MTRGTKRGALADVIGRAPFFLPTAPDANIFLNASCALPPEDPPLDRLRQN